MTPLSDAHVLCIEKAILLGERPRPAMYNARMVGARYMRGHGRTVRDPIVRLFLSNGAVGIGWSRIDREQAESLLGRRFDDLFSAPGGCTELGRAVDLVLWDLAAKMEGLPLYRLLGAKGDREIEVYDGSVYIDDIGLSDREAVRLFQDEVRTGQAFGFRHFKIKVGRGAYWMPTDEGLARDVLVIRTVRDAAGPEARILIDANMGNTLNTALALLDRCADSGIYWFEEPFAEDRATNEAFKACLKERGHDALIADGEYYPPPFFFDLVRDGLIDVVQHDFRAYGLTWWRETAFHIAPWGARCAPHCWGSHVEHFTHAHLAAAVPNYALLESAPVTMPGIMADGWEMRDGKMVVPDLPGAGFDIAPEAWNRGMREDGGFSVSL